MKYFLHRARGCVWIYAFAEVLVVVCNTHGICIEGNREQQQTIERKMSLEKQSVNSGHRKDKKHGVVHQLEQGKDGEDSIYTVRANQKHNTSQSYPYKGLVTGQLLSNSKWTLVPLAVHTASLSTAKFFDQAT